MQNNRVSSPRIGFVSLGCPKALVDSERIISQLRAEGYQICNEYEHSDLVIVNTCGFIEDAVKESLNSIGEAMDSNGRVIVTGCLGGKPENILHHYPNVLAVTGANSLEHVMNAVHTHLPPAHDPFLSLIPPHGIKLTPKHYAYLKISEGCNHRCRFCIIPSLRGDLVSRPVDEVLDEAHSLVDAGVKELLVISQDTSAYGVDLKYQTRFWSDKAVKTRFQDLCQQLSQLGIWIRLHYVYPYPHVDEVVSMMNTDGLLPYLDIPFQHASEKILKSMKRPAYSEKTLTRIQNWRKLCPEIKIRSTFIVGFPGETEEDFQQLLEFLDQAQLDRVGCFPYSAIEGAQANLLDNPVEESVKLERLERFMQKQAEISANKLKNQVGKSLKVLVDHQEDTYLVARSYGEAPEIDGVVIIENNEPIEPGTFINVQVTNSDEHDLYAVIKGAH